MKVNFNDKQIEFEEKMTIESLLEKYFVQLECFAVMLNNVFIQKTKYSEIYLADGDNVTIIEPMQGG